MFDIKRTLSKNKLFTNFENQEITDFIISSHSKTYDYQAGQIMAIRGELLTKIGLVLSGEVEIQKSYPSGKIVVVNKIPAGGVFGEVAIFSSKKTFPSTVVASLDTKIMFLAKTDIIEICFQNKKFLNNLLYLLSEKILILDHKLHFLSGENIRQKLCLYLIESYEKQETLTIRLDMSKRKMAEQFGITRPSLSRELMLMKKEGLIDYGNTYIIIKNLQVLEHYL